MSGGYDPSSVGAIGHMPEGGHGGHRVLGILPDFNVPPILSIEGAAPFAFLHKTHPVGGGGYGNPNGLLSRILRALQIQPIGAGTISTRLPQEYEAGGDHDHGLRPMATPGYDGGGGGGIDLDH